MQLEDTQDTNQTKKLRGNDSNNLNVNIIER